MRGQWISNSSARLETLSRLQLAERSAASPDYAGATGGAEKKRGQVRSWLLTRQRPAEIDDPRCRRIHPCVPHADRRVRHFGFLANRAKKQSLFRCRQLLGLNAALPEIPDRSTEDLLLELTGVDMSRCPACKKGTMVIVAELPKLRSWDSS